MLASGYCNREITFANLEQLNMHLLGYGIDSKIVLVGDRGLLKTLNQIDMPQKLAKRYQLIWIDSVRSNPVQTDILNALRIIGESSPDRIIAVGGGSSIDLAKSISAFWPLFRGRIPDAEEITTAIRETAYLKNKEFIPITAVPTTAGTGSELTKWATIWDVNNKAKYSIDSDALYPKTAIIVPELTYSMPRRLILSTGLDALCHAMESFWARLSTPIIKDIAVIAMIRIQQNLKAAIDNPMDEKAREGLSRGSTLAGMAFANTRTTACHSMSYPMTMQFGVEHGFACAMTLVQVARINIGAVPEITVMLEEVFGGMQAFKDWMDMVCEDIQPLKLSAFGIKSSDIPKLVSAAFTGGRMDNNPIILTTEQVKEVYKGCI